MGHDYHKAKKIALKTILILAVVTVIEVLIALGGKGHLIEGFHMVWWLMGLLMIIGSLYKAYLIVGEFMHMKHEVRALGLSVLLPTLLLVWAIIAFMYEGGAWKGNRQKIEQRNSQLVDESIQPQGMLLRSDVKHLGE
ncbi:MAG: cytochrome C oxidase subunit IV family protein [Saprospiraceae bacterium]|nr:cytochrome C oxidase subunit IV family protein [Saprospiraceae bacterium]